MKNRKVTLSTLWIFAMLNYMYADILTTIDSLAHPAAFREGYVAGVHVTQGALLGAAVLIETAIAMTLLARLLKYRANRWANIIAGAIHTVAVLLSLFLGGTPTLFYAFFGTIEVVCTSVIIWYAWTWRDLGAATA